MRRLLLAIALAAAAVAGPSQAAPPQGIVRPASEAGKPLLQLGSELFAGNCASCHGADGRGVSGKQPTRGAGDVKGQGPSLRGVGARAADFYLRTGYMPLSHPRDQPKRSRVLLTPRERRALVAFVASLGAGPPIPAPAWQDADVAEGQRSFTEHCAGCHQVMARGGVVTGARVPPLQDASPVEIAEAVRVGPYVMPRFSERQIPDHELNSIVKYVQTVAKRPPDRGGWGIGNVGPIPEGMVTWFIAIVVLIGVCMLLGRRLRA
jgi:ubiquinol-cytochrome c reductase cytochrome c subunit